MPQLTLKPCAACPELVRGSRYCAPCRRMRMRDYNARRGSSARQGYGRRWRSDRAAHLAREPLCRDCHAEGIQAAASEVDHIEPQRLTGPIAHDVELCPGACGLAGRCKPHHSRKTALRDGRWAAVGA